MTALRFLRRGWFAVMAAIAAAFDDREAYDEFMAVVVGER